MQDIPATSPSDEDRETRYHQWLLKAWCLMIEDLGWGESRMATKARRMTWLQWLRGLFGPSKVPFESQVNPTDVWSEAHLIQLINVQRVEHGLKPVAIDPALTVIAMKWTASQAKSNRGVYDHGDFGTRAREFPGSPAGEVGAVGYATMTGTLAGWMAGDKHRGQILDPEYTIAGASRAVASDGTTYTGCDFAAHPAKK